MYDRVVRCALVSFVGSGDIGASLMTGLSPETMLLRAFLAAFTLAIFLTRYLFFLRLM